MCFKFCHSPHCNSLHWNGLTVLLKAHNKVFSWVFMLAMPFCCNYLVLYSFVSVWHNIRQSKDQEKNGRLTLKNASNACLEIGLVSL